MIQKIASFLSICLCMSCIGTDVIDDFVEPTVSIDNPIESLRVDNTFQFTATYRNNVGAPAPASFEWRSSDETVLRIDNEGLALGVKEGEATVYAMANGITDSLFLEVGDTTIIGLNERLASLRTVSSYPLSGNALLRKEGGRTFLELDESFVTTSALPGLYVYLTNNTSNINNALEVGKVVAFSGAQTYEIIEDIDLTTYDFVLFYCKPFLVPVGEGELMP